MRVKYPAIFTQDGECVLVEVPDLGILTEGKNMRDAINMERDAIGQKGITMQDHQQKVPEASAIEEIDVHAGTFADAGPGTLVAVDVDFDAFRREYDTRSTVNHGHQ